MRYCLDNCKNIIAVGAVALAFAAPLVRSAVELHLAMRGQGANPDHPSVVMLGDSHVEFVNWPLLTHCRNVANHGVGGNDTAQILARLPEVLAQNPKLVILMAGTNDARRYVPFSETLNNLRAIKSNVEAAGIKFVSLTPPPLPSRSDRIEISIHAATITVPFTEDDLMADQIHLRRSGYAKWRDVVAPLVSKFC